MSRKMVTIDGNTACANIAYATSEVITIYPITPSSPMADIADAKATAKQENIWGSVPVVSQMQSEAGVAGAVHGSLGAGAMCTTFTASQGLLLMIPNMYKIAGELTPTVFHITARALACQGLSIFGDHGDVMAARQAGWAMLCSQDVQEAQDLALIATQSTLASRVPFIHFFDGFRTSHEVMKIEELSMDDIRFMIDEDLVIEHRKRALTPDRPSLAGTAQNPDVNFTGRETVNKYYDATPGIVQETMNKFAELTGRQYHLFDYVGAPDATDVIVIMGSGALTVAATIEHLIAREDRKAGLVIVRLFRPFDAAAMVNALPSTVERITVMDRTKEPGAIGEPLYEDVCTALTEALERNPTMCMPAVYGGRFGLGSAEFSPAMVKAILDNMASFAPKKHFCVGPHDDVSFTSLDYDLHFNIEGEDVYRAMFYGLGSDGTVGANKNTIKIIGTETDNSTQGYFVYDSKKSGSMTVSHLRFGKKQVVAPYLITKANFIACHNFAFLNSYDMLANLHEGGTFLLTSTYDKDEIWQHLPALVQKQLIEKKARFYIIDAVKLGLALGLGARINMIMQTAFFKISGILPEQEAIDAIKKAIKKTYGSKGDKVVQMNYSAVDGAIANIFEVNVPESVNGHEMPPTVPEEAPAFVKDVTARMMAGRGESIKVSQMPADGRWPTATTQWEKRNIAVKVSSWDPEACIQCGRCSLVCPHASIRMKVATPEALQAAGADESFKTADAMGKEFAGMKFTIQISTADCCGCTLCVSTCPGRKKDANGKRTDEPALAMVLNTEELYRQEAPHWKTFMALPEVDEQLIDVGTIKGSQFKRPLFEFSGACAGCGETPYVKLVTQLFGDRMLASNATGCSSIYSGNLPTTPYAKRADGRGPAWSNSLFEDNAEHGLGMRDAVDKLGMQAGELLEKAVEAQIVAKELADSILDARQDTQMAIEAQRARIDELKKVLEQSREIIAKRLYHVADYLVKKSVWIIGGDGWGYDIGYGGLDHVLASGKNVNVLLLDTEVYSNTGGQMSKSTPRAAVAQFASSGKTMPKKNMGMIFSTFGTVYVARISIGANPTQAVRAIKEAEAYDGPSLVICYAHCINHGIDMAKGLEQQKKAVECGHWSLFRYNPDLEKAGKNPMIIDSKEPTISFAEYAMNENRYRRLKMSNAEHAAELMQKSQEDVDRNWKLLKGWAKALETE